MKKLRILATLLMGFILTSLAGCGSQMPAMPETNTDTAISSTSEWTAAVETAEAVPTHIIHTEGIPPDSTETDEIEPAATAERSEESASEPAEAETALPEPVETTAPAREQPQTPEETTPPPKPTESAQEPQRPSAPPVQEKPTEPAMTEPAETRPPVTEALATESPTTEPVVTEPAETEPAFDVGYWVSYAKSYAQSIGLELDSEAVSCWDNPSIASANSEYLERDLCGMLSKYNRDEDISAVWIWAEPRTETTWDIYIGYA